MNLKMTLQKAKIKKKNVTQLPLIFYYHFCNLIRRNSGTAIVHLIGNMGSFASPLVLYLVSKHVSLRRRG